MLAQIACLMIALVFLPDTRQQGRKRGAFWAWAQGAGAMVHRHG
jgi:hypothetical protein